MSSVYIKGMQMPKACVYRENGHFMTCPLYDVDGYCGALNREAKHDLETKLCDCPLIPVPDHGRLIDADALITTFCEWGTRLERGRKLVITMSEAKQAIVDIIDDAPTIIPADKEADNG